MADKLLKSIKFPTLPDRYVIGDSTLTEEGAAADAKATGDEITNVKSDINYLFAFEDVAVSRTTSGWRINGSGSFSSNSDYRLDEYPVTAGDIIYINSADRYVFESAVGTPITSTKVLTAFEGNVTVPENATYIIMSMPTADTTSKISLAISGESTKESVEKCKSDINEIDFDTNRIIVPSKIDSGWRLNSTGTSYSSDSSYTVKRFKVTGGEKIYVASSDRMVFESEISTIISGTFIGVPFKGELTTTESTKYVSLSMLNSDTKSGVYSSGMNYIAPTIVDLDVFTDNLMIGGGGTQISRTGTNPIDPLDFESDGSYNGLYNTFVGRRAGELNTTGNGNTFVGSSCGIKNVNGDQNTFLGWYAGREMVDGYHNTFLGVGAGQENVHGYFNTYVGCDCALTATGGNANVSVGTSSSSKNNGTYNTVVGCSAFQKNVDGGQNVAVGTFALTENTSNYNTAVGYLALGKIDNQYARGNTALGNQAGSSANLTSGHYNTFVGYKSGASANQVNSLENATAIGYDTYTTKSNQVVIGNSSVSEIVIGGKVIKFNNDGTVTWESQ